MQKVRESHSHGQSTATCVDGLAVVLGKAAPNPVGLADLEGVGSTLAHHGALRADGLGRSLTGGPGRTPFALRMEEDAGVFATAGAFELPVPDVGIRAGEP